MSRNLVTGCGAAFAVLLISGQCVFAQKLSDEQRDEVKSIVAETEKKIGEQIKASTNELAALIKSQRSDPSPAQSQSAEVPSSTTLQLLAASLVGQTQASQTQAATGNDFSTIFQQAYAQAKRCDDLERRYCQKSWPEKLKKGGVSC
ncbi:MAG: hypothetical protein O2983_11045 [Planctomycetota bacterium]|nr:hypothetical protein [Planctomycetota bacterium]MDA0920782.1 hypothetical protein [Planctomycetota bacterium]MDA1160137.1 hypothetical protein [Planctomycetota bacterium]